MLGLSLKTSFTRFFNLSIESSFIMAAVMLISTCELSSNGLQKSPQFPQWVPLSFSSAVWSLRDGSAFSVSSGLSADINDNGSGKSVRALRELSTDSKSRRWEMDCNSPTIAFNDPVMASVAPGISTSFLGTTTGCNDLLTFGFSFSAVSPNPCLIDKTSYQKWFI